jgi:hypothetical protein
MILRGSMGLLTDSATAYQESLHSLALRTASSIGRSAPSTGPQDVCAMAASAKARGSSAYASLAAQCAALRPVALDQSVNMQQPADDEGIPRPVIIGAAAVGVLALGLLAFKLLKK